MQHKNDAIISKYHDIIAEELNVKEIKQLDDAIVVKKIYKPLGNKLSAKFGKDTGNIIQLGKQGNTRELPNGQLVIFDVHDNQRILDNDDYVVDYEGLSGDAMAAETGIIIKYDLEISPALAQEGIAREISRFLNQMRKNAGFSVEKKALCLYHTHSDILQAAIDTRQDFLLQEALLSDIIINHDPKGDHSDTFSTDEGSVVFVLSSS